MFEIPKEYNKKLLFISVSGSHVYGSPNTNSDIDLRGCHIEKTEDVLRIRKPNFTYEKSFGENDVVTHEIEKYLSLLLHSNGNLQETVRSPIILYKDKYFFELQKVADLCVSKQLHAHYRGFAAHMLHHAYHSDERRHKKNVMYMFRNLLSGIHVLRTGEFVMNSQELFEIYDFKINMNNYTRQAKEIFNDLDEAKTKSSLKDKIEEDAWNKANELLLKIREENSAWWCGGVA